MTLSSFANKVYDYCTDKELFVGVSCIVAGLSGGPDSVALISVLKELHDNKRAFPAIAAVHVNHGLRKSAADDEFLGVARRAFFGKGGKRKTDSNHPCRKKHGTESFHISAPFLFSRSCPPSAGR